jgi:hypothetical protein
MLGLLCCACAGLMEVNVLHANAAAIIVPARSALRRLMFGFWAWPLFVAFMIVLPGLKRLGRYSPLLAT